MELNEYNQYSLMEALEFRTQTDDTVTLRYASPTLTHIAMPVQAPKGSSTQITAVHLQKLQHNKYINMKSIE